MTDMYCVLCNTCVSPLLWHCCSSLCVNPQCFKQAGALADVRYFQPSCPTAL